MLIWKQSAELVPEDWSPGEPSASQQPLDEREMNLCGWKTLSLVCMVGFPLFVFLSFFLDIYLCVCVNVIGFFPTELAHFHKQVVQPLICLINQPTNLHM